MSWLQVAMNGRPVAHWSVEAGRHALVYLPSWLDAPEARPLSLSLPLRGADSAHRGVVVERWFENLLPDDPTLRERLRRRFDAPSTAAMDLLAEVGRDCVGAVQLLPPDRVPDRPAPPSGRPLDTGEVASLLRDARSTGVPGRHDESAFRLSLAGAQEKSALTRVDGAWWLPDGPTPTTHILKRPLGRVALDGIDLSSSVANEHVCLRLLHHLGLETANSWIEWFEDEETLVVERFDRRFAADGASLLRLPQEDFCQARGLSRDDKYEADGGPGIDDGLALLSGSSRAAADRDAFLSAQLIFLALAAVDGHAKNFSLFIEPGARYRLTPLYDVLSVRPYMDGPNLPRRRVALAMGWHGRNRHYRLHEIQARPVVATAARAGLSRRLPVLPDRLCDRWPYAAEATRNETADAVPDTLVDAIIAPSGEALSALRDAVRALR